MAEDKLKRKEAWLSKALAGCMEANPDSLWKCNKILRKFTKAYPSDAVKKDDPKKTIKTIGVKGPNYGKTKAKYQRQPRKED